MGEPSAGLSGESTPSGVQIVRRRLRARQRPLLLVAPVAADEDAAFRRLVRIAAAHHIDADRRLAVHAVVDSLQPMVEPAQMKRPEIERRVFGELRLAGDSCGSRRCESTGRRSAAAGSSWPCSVPRNSGWRPACPRNRTSRWCDIRERLCIRPGDRPRSNRNSSRSHRNRRGSWPRSATLHNRARI